MALLRLYPFLFIVTAVFPQNTEMYLSLIKEGKSKEVIDNLPELLSKYPNTPGVKFITAVVESDGEKAVQLYKDLIEQFPESKYSDDAATKIGEYYYACGLYTQASTQLRSMLLSYPNSEHLQRSMDLMVRSYLAIGEKDSLKKYLSYFKNQYPKLNFNKYGFMDLNDQPQSVLPHENMPTAGKPWVIQVGAFGKYDNALRLQKKLRQNGYPVIISEVTSNSRQLHVVRVGGYSFKPEAERIGRDLNRRFGLDYRVLNNSN